MNYKLFGARTGLYTSELILGGSMLGSRKGYGATAADAKEILSTYSNAGGNVIDLSDQYQFGEAEEIVGDFIAGSRESYIICSKYTRSNVASPALGNTGNHRKAMRQAVDSSLRRLKTDYIDIYMPHYDDGVTPLEEIGRGLEDLVRAGKVLYMGLANFPAWKIAAIAGAIPLSAIQIEYNLSQRTADRELLPMAKHFGLGTMLYSPLAGGMLTGKYRKGEKGRMNLTGNAALQENEVTTEVINYLLEIAGELQATPGQIALAWVMGKGGFPIIGPRTLSHLKESLGATTLILSREHIDELDRISAVSLGYPHDLLATVQRANRV